MRRIFLCLFVAGAVSLGLAYKGLSATGGTHEISMSDLRDKIEGGWAGQMIGVSYGAPTEFRFRERIAPEKDTPEWKPERVSNSLEQDDLYVDMTFAKVLDDKDLNVTTEDFGAMFKMRSTRYGMPTWRRAAL